MLKILKGISVRMVSERRIGQVLLGVYDELTFYDFKCYALTTRITAHVMYFTVNRRNPHFTHQLNEARHRPLSVECQLNPF